MNLQIRHIFYGAGLIAILTSYIFRATLTGSSFIHMAGSLAAALAFLFILSRDRSKTILIAFALAIVTLVIQLTLREYLAGISYNIILTRNKEAFEKANSILISKKGKVSYPLATGDTDNIFSIAEIQVLNQFRKETSVNYMQKDEQKIFYPLWGIPLEMDYGLFYFYSGAIPTTHFNHIKDKWYFDK